MGGKLYIETVGCQMNVLDSELVVGSLRRQGYELTHEPTDADVILFNTCSVRQHAEDKIYSALGRLRAHKSTPSRQDHRRPRLHGPEGPGADPAAGPVRRHRLRHRPAVTVAGAARRSAQTTGKPQLAVSLDRKEASRHEVERSFESYDPLRDPSMRPTPFQAFVRIMIGCDKFCTYCIVPSVRGPEQSRPPEHIAAEVRQLAAEGCKEITLLGQTVNSYQYDHGDGRRERLSDLLLRIHDTPGIERIKFVTNFPSDMTDDLLDAVRDLPKVCPYLHVPAQSGCNEVLKRMKRLYTVEYYRDMLAALPRARAGRGDQQRFHRRLLRRDGGSRSSRPATWCARPVQEQLHLQVQPAARHQGRRAVCRRRAGGGQEAAQQRSAGDPERRQPGRPSPLDRPDGRGAGRRTEQDGAQARDRPGAEAVDRPDA